MLAAVDGKWLDVRRASRGETRQYAVPDVFTDVVKNAKLSKLAIEELYGKPGVYAATKRQLSRKEIAALALNR